MHKSDKGLAALNFTEESVYEILVIDGDLSSVELVSDALKDSNFNVCGASDAESGLDFVRKRRPPIVVLDLMIPGGPGMDLLEGILAIDPGTDVIVLHASYSTDSAVEAIQKGAYDYLTKPLLGERLRQKLAKWLEDARLRQEASRLDHQLLNTFQFEGIVGRSPLMLEVYSKIRRIAPHFQTALVTGATGTGKELVAQALHRLGPHPAGPFVVCNCAAITESLFESELFGHVRGAFTNASQDKQGLGEAANGGTLFLDEITEIPLNVQAKLLRLVQNQEIQRVGSPRPKHIDVRIVAASNRDLRSLVAENKLREDLYYRLSMVEVKLPRLAQRQEDLVLLQHHFLEKYSKRYGKPRLNLTRRAQALMAAHSWPGNIRELENVLGCCCMMAERKIIDLSDLPEQMQGLPFPPQDKNDGLFSMEIAELQHALRVLDRVGGNRPRAAEILGIGRTTLYRLIRKCANPVSKTVEPKPALSRTKTA